MKISPNFRKLNNKIGIAIREVGANDEYTFLNE